MEEFNPQQLEFIKNYFDRKSDTFGNARQSGLRAGFEETYANNITHLMPNWLKGLIKKEGLLEKAEKNINDLLDDKDSRIKLDITKFVMSRIGKWSEKSEVDVTSGGEKITGFNYIKPDENSHNKTDENTA